MIGKLKSYAYLLFCRIRDLLVLSKESLYRGDGFDRLFTKIEILMLLFRLKRTLKIPSATKISLVFNENNFLQNQSLAVCRPHQDRDGRIQLFEVIIGGAVLDSRVPRTIRFLVISHEMVHVSQMVQGHLSHRYIEGKGEDAKFIISWKGSNYNNWETNYYEMPWEVEAHALESKLMREQIECYYKKGANLKGLLVVIGHLLLG